MKFKFMRTGFAIILLFFITSYTSGQSSNKFDLGSYYFYRVSENSIYRGYDTITLNQKEFRIVHKILPKIKSFGFNNKYILAIQKHDQTSFYWIIDKILNPLDNGYSDKEDRLLLPNVRSTDSANFMKIKKRLAIEIHPVSYYLTDQN
jgi:hypothetical protein